MKNNKTNFTEELRRTLQWISKNPNKWNVVNESSGNMATPEEISEAIDMFTEEKLYVPLVLYLINDFGGIKGRECIQRIYINLLLSQWSEETLDKTIQTIKDTVQNCLEEQSNTI